MAKKDLSQLARKLERKQGLRFHVGMDVHKDSYSVAFRCEDETIHTFVGPANPEFLIRMIQSAKIQVVFVAYEAGPTGFGLARALKAAHIKVVVVAPSKVARPVTRGAKTDRLDCIKLADFAAKGMLKSIAIPTVEEESDRALVRRRNDLAQEIRKTKQRIRSLLLFVGADSDHTWSDRSLEGLKKIELHPSVGETLQSLLRQLKFYAVEKRFLQKKLKALMEKPEYKEVVECLKTVPGVGEVTATTFVLEMFQPERFDSSDQVASMIGLCPIVFQSGAGKPIAYVVPTGQKTLRSNLVEASWKWQAWEPGIGAFYRKILSRTGHTQKAIVAVARKLATVLWRLAVEKRPYRMLSEAA